jgi:short-subunit dehydrogenase
VANRYQNVLITGASSGIGRAMALWWWRRGANVWATARRLDALEALRQSADGRIHPITMDVSREAETVARIQAIDEQCGGLDLVVANAGVGAPTPARRADWGQVEQVLRTNVMGAAATLTAVLPRMVQRGQGHVVGISSVASYTGLGAYSSYCGSKAFLSVFLESVRIDLHGTGVKATCIEPGFVNSEGAAQLDGKVARPFMVSTDAAAEKFGRAIERGVRRLAWPKVHAWSSALLRWVPSPVLEPVAKRISESQLRLLDGTTAQGVRS